MPEEAPAATETNQISINEEVAKKIGLTQETIAQVQKQRAETALREKRLKEAKDSGAQLYLNLKAGEPVSGINIGVTGIKTPTMRTPGDVFPVLNEALEQYHGSIPADVRELLQEHLSSFSAAAFKTGDANTAVTGAEFITQHLLGNPNPNLAPAGRTENPARPAQPIADIPQGFGMNAEPPGLHPPGTPNSGSTQAPPVRPPEL